MVPRGSAKFKLLEKFEANVTYLKKKFKKSSREARKMAMVWKDKKGFLVRMFTYVEPYLGLLAFVYAAVGSMACYYPSS